MLKRTLVMLATPGLIAGGLIFSAGTASAAAAPPIECKLYSINDTSIASCRYSREYQHWIRCENDNTTAELVEKFNGKRNHLSCPADYDLVDHAIGAAI
ncbi:hypothetical protein LDL08_29630 [Nonomuraea glycinis]|uniref:Secreted protein n=1 Tax=Nonomuraea glycinis TaxID=2047744 RepID=A0A918A1F3_9ACTN|nr:hypothetical protein [Nonomuraea glycinis]MCA2180349.1 hypothetical protein [Nonomuraea glycinis]GGP04045.1 hypothetical protein GCM10012278_17780 [Nonomuraea glycinis]